MTKTLILLNGPPRSGKDTAARIIKKKLHQTVDFKMSTPLKEMMISTFQIHHNAFKYLESDKDEPWDIMGGMSPREFQIWLSEDVLKPKFGKDHLGIVAARVIDQQVIAAIVTVDIGCDLEVAPLVKRFGAINMRCIQLARPDTSFVGDSRSYIDTERFNIKTAYINNQYELDMFELQIEKALKEWHLLQSDG